MPGFGACGLPDVFDKDKAVDQRNRDRDGCNRFYQVGMPMLVDYALDYSQVAMGADLPYDISDTLTAYAFDFISNLVRIGWALQSFKWLFPIFVSIMPGIVSGLEMVQNDIPQQSELEVFKVYCK